MSNDNKAKYKAFQVELTVTNCNTCM